MEAAAALNALSQPSRLQTFRLLVSSKEPICAGDLADQLSLPKPTLSFHLKELQHAGLIESHREGRSIYYSIRGDGMRDLLAFLVEDCCQGRPELCLPAMNKSACSPVENC